MFSVPSTPRGSPSCPSTNNNYKFYDTSNSLSNDFITRDMDLARRIRGRSEYGFWKMQPRGPCRYLKAMPDQVDLLISRVGYSLYLIGVKLLIEICDSKRVTWLFGSVIDTVRQLNIALVSIQYLIYVDLKNVQTWYSHQMKHCRELPQLLIASQIHVYSIWNYFPEQTNSNVIFRIGDKIWSYGRQVTVKFSVNMYGSLSLSSSAQNLAIIFFQGQSCLQP